MTCGHDAIEKMNNRERWLEAKLNRKGSKGKGKKRGNKEGKMLKKKKKGPVVETAAVTCRILKQRGIPSRSSI